MKKLLILIIVVAVVSAVYMYRSVFFSQSANNTPSVVRDTVPDNHPPQTFTMAKINHVTLTLDDGEENKTVNLTREGTDGNFSGEIKSDYSPIAGSIVLLGAHALYTSSSGDIFIPYAVNYGGSGSFIYIGLFTQTDETTLTFQDSHLIGDRVLLENLSIDTNGTPYTLRVTYRDRKEGESFAATPTVLKEMQVIVLVHVFGKATVK